MNGRCGNRTGASAAMPALNTQKQKTDDSKVSRPILTHTQTTIAHVTHHIVVLWVRRRRMLSGHARRHQCLELVGANIQQLQHLADMRLRWLISVCVCINKIKQALRHEFPLLHGVRCEGAARCCRRARAGARETERARERRVLWLGSVSRDGNDSNHRLYVHSAPLLAALRFSV